MSANGEVRILKFRYFETVHRLKKSFVIQKIFLNFLL